MHAIVPNVGLPWQAQRLPVLENLLPNRPVCRLGRVRRAQHLAAEVGPRQRPLLPLHRKVVDRRPILGVRLPHRHEEAVDHKQVRWIRRGFRKPNWWRAAAGCGWCSRIADGWSVHGRGSVVWGVHNRVRQSAGRFCCESLS